MDVDNNTGSPEVESVCAQSGRRVAKVTTRKAHLSPLLEKAIFGLGFSAMLMGSAHAVTATCTDTATTADCTTGDFPNGISYAATSNSDFILTLDGAAMTVEGSGVKVTGAGAKVSIVGENVGTITLSTAKSSGLYALNKGLGASSVLMHAGTIRTTGKQGYGLHSAVSKATSTATASVSMTGGSITTSGSSAQGVMAKNSGSGETIITLSGDATVNTTGSNAEGLFALGDMDGSVAVTVFGGTISTSGSDADAVVAMTKGLSANLGATAVARQDAGVIITTNADSSGLIAQVGKGSPGSNKVNGNAMTIQNGGSITTSGVRSYGAIAYVSPTATSGVAVARQLGGSITTHGDNADGLFAFSMSGSASLMQSASASIRTTGVSSDGMRVISSTDDAYTVNAAGSISSGTKFSAAIHGVSMAGGTIDVADTALIDGSASNIAIRDGDVTQDGTDMIGGNVVVTTAGTVTGDAILGLGDDTFKLTGGTYTGDIYGDDRDVTSSSTGDDTFDWTAGKLIGGFNGQDGADTATITAVAWSDFAAVTHVDGGPGGTGDHGDVLTLDNIQYKGGSFAHDDVAKGINLGTGWDTINLTNGTVWEMTGDLTLDDPMLNIDASSTLEAGNGLAPVIGSPGLAVAVDNAGTMDLTNGASGATDTLTIHGNYAGSNGTLKVDTVLGDDLSASDKLVISGNATGATSVLVNKAGGSGAKTSAGILVVDVDGTSDAGAFTLGNGDYQLSSGEKVLVAGAYGYALRQVGSDWYLQSAGLNPSVPVYESYPQVLLGMNEVSTLQQRVGNRSWASEQHATATRQATTVDGNGLWAKAQGMQIHAGTEGSTTATSFKQDQQGVQTGMDVVLPEVGTGTLIGELTAHAAGSSTKVSSNNGDGSISLRGYGLGASLTWYGDNGLYTDGRVQASWYDGKLSSAQFGELVRNNNGFGYALSMELGKCYAHGNGWAVTPQTQLVYSKVRFKSFVGPNGADVLLTDGDSLKARLGVSLDREYAGHGESGLQYRNHIYGIANLHYEFLGDSTVAISGMDVSRSPQRLALEAGFGDSYNWHADRYSVYAEVSALSSVSHFADSYRIKGGLGLRVNF